MIPKLCIGDAWPGDPVCWIARLRNPFVIARAEPRGILGVHLDCWPVAVETTIPPGKLRKVIEGLAGAWCEHVDELPGLPSSWSFTFGVAKPPEFLLLDACESSWTGILDLDHGLLWHVADVGDGSTSIEWLREFGTAEPVWPRDSRRVTKWYREFCKAEDQLPEYEDD